ncbi:uncharacterized protein LOC115765935 [Drosophila novamexicana]|uniref:uncharacterized protein LOC115765935 n=1 Tax=Drosophila novamexicana TaxID=47314 RepID=UPI0011E5A6F6|nr:uncharacterized protein LOC115765935 [Drosophila novamexicana]
MGNVLEAKVSCDRPVAVVQPMPAVSSSSPAEDSAATEQEEAEEESYPKANVTLHLFHYRQQMALKDHHVVKWATSKLLLTEELLKQQESQLPRSHALLDDDAAWAESQLALLTDDEEDANDENLAPMEQQGLGNELNNLMKYRLKLRDTIVQVAQEKMRKREKTKLKRLKRRTLISSKKPSNKDKHRQAY